MDNNGKRTAKVPVILILAGFIIVIAGIKAANSILVPFFLAMFIAVICAPPLFWLQRKGVPKLIALLSHSGGYPGCGIALRSIDRSSAGSFLEIPSRLSGAIIDPYRYFNKLAAEKGINIPADEVPERSIRGG